MALAVAGAEIGNGFDVVKEDIGAVVAGPVFNVPGLQKEKFSFVAGPLVESSWTCVVAVEVDFAV